MSKGNGHNGRNTFHASDVGNSPYFTREDVGDGVAGTISAITHENVAPPDKDEDWKYCVSFEEHTKKLVLNKARTRQITALAGGPSEKDWVGTGVEMFDDPSVEFAGKQVGGIRVRAPSQGDRPTSAHARAEAAEDLPY